MYNVEKFPLLMESSLICPFLTTCLFQPGQRKHSTAIYSCEYKHSDADLNAFV